MAHPPLDYSTDETTRLQVGASTLQQQARLPFHAFLNSFSSDLAPMFYRLEMLSF